MSTKDARVYHKEVHNVCLAACHKTSKTWSDGRDAIVECVVTVREEDVEKKPFSSSLDIVLWRCWRGSFFVFFLDDHLTNGGCLFWFTVLMLCRSC